MIFETIFNFSTLLSQAGGSAENTVSNRLPTTPAETTHVPPHDPSQPYEVGVQDPKIVRETIPPLRAVFDYLGSVTGSIEDSTTAQASAVKDPASTADAATAIFTKGSETTSKLPEKVSKPSVDPSPQPDVPPNPAS